MPRFFCSFGEWKAGDSAQAPAWKCVNVPWTCSNWKMPPCETQKLHEGEASIFQDIKFGCAQPRRVFQKTPDFFWTEILTSVFRRWAVGCLWCIYHGFIGVCLFPSSSKAASSTPVPGISSCNSTLTGALTVSSICWRGFAWRSCQMCKWIQRGKKTCFGLFSNIYNII